MAERLKPWTNTAVRAQDEAFGAIAPVQSPSRLVAAGDPERQRLAPLPIFEATPASP